MYPIALNPARLRCVVVGAGGVALRKVRALVSAGCKPVVVGERAAAEIRALAAAGRIDLLVQSYEPGLLASANLVFAATDSPELNRQVAAGARDARALVNVVDDPDASDFHNLSQFSEGGIMVAAGTGGRSPALARALRIHLRRSFPDRPGALLSAFERWRRQIESRLGDPRDRERIWRRLLRRDLLGTLLRDGEDAADAAVREALDGATSEG